MLNKSFQQELFTNTLAIHKSLNKIKFLGRVQLCQGNSDWRQGKSGKCQGILFCPVCMNPVL